MRAIEKPAGIQTPRRATFSLLAIASCLSLAACGMSKDEKMQFLDLQAEMRQKITVVLLAKNLEGGKTLTADDIEVKEIPYYMYPYNAYTAPFESKKEDSKVIGCVTTRYLGEGAVLMPGDIYPPKDKAQSDAGAEKKSDKNGIDAEANSNKKESSQ